MPLLVPPRALIALATAGAILAGPAAAMTVQPVVVDLKPSGRDASATIRVENSFNAPLPVELSVQALDLDENGVKPTGKDTGEVVVFPLQAMIPAGQTQAFRIQWVGDQRLARSRHYYVTVAQLPVQMAENQSAIQILYNFQILTNVASATGHAQLSVDRAEVAMITPPAPPTPVSGALTAPPADTAQPNTPRPRPVLFLKNSGPTYGYLSQNMLRITQYDPSGKQIFTKLLQPQDIQQSVGFGLVGPDTSRRFVLPVDLPSANGTIRAELSRAPNQ